MRIAGVPGGGGIVLGMGRLFFCLIPGLVETIYAYAMW